MVPPKQTNLARASFRLRHSLLRRAAGEHTLRTYVLLIAFAGEWGLNNSEISVLSMRAEQWETELGVHGASKGSTEIPKTPEQKEHR